jgi:hypothetical protein
MEHRAWSIEHRAWSKGHTGRSEMWVEKKRPLNTLSRRLKYYRCEAAQAWSTGTNDH